MGSGVAETPEEFIEALKSIRGWMLSDTDWTQSNDCPLDEETKEAWRLWRQEFRDITQHINVDNVKDYFEISDPPEKGQPATWHWWQYENFYNITQIFEDINTQTQELMTHQQQEAEHARLHETGEYHVH